MSAGVDSRLSELLRAWVGKLDEHWQEQLETEPSGRLLDPTLARPASCATSFQVAALELAAHQTLGRRGAWDRARRIVADAATRQNSDGSFGQPYYVPVGEPDTVDIAEIGASGRALYALARAGADAAGTVLTRAAAYLVGQAHPTRPGVIYKRADATHHDVLNGDAYAGDVFFWAAELTGEAMYRRMATDVTRHLHDRFGRASRGWWPYTEDWDGNVTLGNNVAYQGTIVAFTAPWYARLGDEGLSKDYGQTLVEATHTVLDQVRRPQEEREEDRAVWWAVHDRLSWETVLALWHMRDRVPEGLPVLTSYLQDLLDSWEAQGAGVFDPTGLTQPDATRNPVTTRFRRIATAGGIVAYMLLDV